MKTSNMSLRVNVILNTIRQSLTILLPLITFPYISRTLGAKEFGKYTFSSSIIMYFQLFSAFGISTFAIREGAPIRDNRRAISNLASDLFSFNIITCAIAYAALFLLILLNPKIYSYSLLVLIQSLCMLLTLLGLDWVNNVYEDFLYITIRYIIIQIIALISIFIFVQNSADTYKYCLILLCGSYGGNIINLFYIRRYINFPKLRAFAINKYITPLSVLFINSLAVTIYVNSDVTMIGFILNDTEVGLYGFSSKIYNIIKYFINAAIVVTIPRLAAIVHADHGKYNSLIQTIFSKLIIFLLPVVAGLFMLSKQIIIIAGGDEYIGGSSALMILGFSLIFALPASICTNCILLIHKLERKVLFSTIISAVINVTLNIMLIPAIGIVGAAITTVIAEFSNLFIQSSIIKKELKIPFSIKLKDFFLILFGITEVVVVCFICGNIWSDLTAGNCIKQVATSFILSGILYFPSIYLSSWASIR